MLKAYPLRTDSGIESWTVLDDELRPIAPIDEYLGFLTVLGRSPNTVRAYAHDLCQFFRFLAITESDWTTTSVETLAEFTRWMSSGGLNVLSIGGATARSPKTVNRALAAVYGFLEFQARRVPEFQERFRTARASRSRYKGFLHHTKRGNLERGRPILLKEEQRRPRTLSTKEVEQLLEACGTRRDRLLIATLYETGMRIGQALGLRHEDWGSRHRSLRIVPREDNVNGARAKTTEHHDVPISASLVRLYSDYMHLEYRGLDCDYVFVSGLSSPDRVRPMTYATAISLVRRLRHKTGIDFTLHMFRHTHVTELLAEDVPIDVVSKRVTHKSSVVTSQIYSHISSEQIRGHLERAGFLDGASS